MKFDNADNDSDVTILYDVSTDIKKRPFKKRSTAMKMRLFGKQYTGFKRIGRTIVQNIPKKAKSIGQRCGHSDKRIGPRSYLYGLITDARRRIIFDEFWSIPKLDS